MVRTTVEACIWIDVRRWHREGRLQPGIHFPYAWSYGGEPAGDINVRAEQDAVVLMYRVNGRSIKERVAITWTPVHFAGRRPWFVCPVQRCGRRVAILYGAGELFACRHCYDLTYESEREPVHLRGMWRATKIVGRLGGDHCADFPDKPKGMRWATYERWRDAYDAAMDHSMRGFGLFAETLSRRRRKH
jgi:hypothetical protein